MSPAKNEVQGRNHFDKTGKFKADVALDDADANYFGALLLPGGVTNPDQLRVMPTGVEFLRKH